MDNPEDARIRRVGEILDQLRAGARNAEEFRALMEELDRLGRVVDPNNADDFGGALAIPIDVEYEWFAESLKNRQASKFLDFYALYEKKAELDRKLLGS